MNVILAEDGKHYKRTDVNGGCSLVIDLGGHTTDWLAVNPGGAVDYSLTKSTPIGIQQVAHNFVRNKCAQGLALDACCREVKSYQLQCGQCIGSTALESGVRYIRVRINNEP